MAHGIYNKERDFQIAEEVAWHKLTRVKKPEVADFPEITPMPLHFNGGKNMVYGNRKFFVPVAMDDMLPVAPPYCGETILEVDDAGCPPKDKDIRGTYILFTPREAWQWVKDSLAGTEFDVKSIGMLWNRSFWFISTELTELKSLSVGYNDDTRFQLNFSGGLDRSVSPQCELSSIRAVCFNTISLSRSTGKILFHERATKHFSDRLAEAKSEIASAVGMTAVFAAAMNKLVEYPCNKERATNIFAGYLTDYTTEKLSKRTHNTIMELTSLHSNGLGNRGETEYDLLNAYTQQLTHGSVTSKTPIGRRFASSEFGNNADAKSDFYDLLTSNRRNILPEMEERGERLLATA